MSNVQLPERDLFEIVHGFIVAAESNDLTDDQWTAFEDLLRESDDACRLYAKYMDVSMLLPVVLESTPDEATGAAESFNREPQNRAYHFSPEVWSNLWRGTVSYFASGWPAVFLITSVIYAIGLVLYSFIPVSPVAEHLAAVPGDRAAFERQKNCVGRVTGMVNCEWTDTNTTAGDSVDVPLGRKYELRFGLLEITYNSGAKVILQGPISYVVESANGGYLSLGKLTAKIDTSAASTKASPSTPHASLFTVKTPNAVVTDLGTEFGVEVNEEGVTTSYVFRGTVDVKAVSHTGKEAVSSCVLHENEGACVESIAGDDGANLLLRRVPVDPLLFKRQLSSPSKLVDLLDIVAGGDGMGQNRDQGLDPTLGLEETQFTPARQPSDGMYHRTTYKMVDGIFQPDGRQGPVQVDSAGHRFADFPKTDGVSLGPIWARGTTSPPEYRNASDAYWIYCANAASQFDRFMPQRRGVLGLHANAGITFDLSAICNAHALRLTRFRATAGKVFATSADLWVLVDGQLRWKAVRMSNGNGAMRIDVPLQPGDRFLTLVATDGGDGWGGDWVVFGDPVLEAHSIQ